MNNFYDFMCLNEYDNKWLHYKIGTVDAYLKFDYATFYHGTMDFYVAIKNTSTYKTRLPVAGFVEYLKEGKITILSNQSVIETLYAK
jgi:hypothetical protein